MLLYAAYVCIGVFQARISASSRWLSPSSVSTPLVRARFSRTRRRSPCRRRRDVARNVVVVLVLVCALASFLAFFTVSLPISLASRGRLLHTFFLLRSPGLSRSRARIARPNGTAVPPCHRVPNVFVPRVVIRRKLRREREDKWTDCRRYRVKRYASILFARLCDERRHACHCVHVLYVCVHVCVE